jgi:hypothetical protein
MGKAMQLYTKYIAAARPLVQNAVFSADVNAGAYFVSTFISLCVYGGFAIALLVLWFSSSWMAYYGTPLYWIVAEHWGYAAHATSSNFNVLVVLGCACALGAVAYLGSLVCWKYVDIGLHKRRNPSRWIIESLLTPSIGVAIALAMLHCDLYALLAYWIALHIVSVLGFYQEVNCEPGKPVSVGAWIYAFWTFALGSTPLIVYLVYLNVNASIPAATWAAFAVWWFERIVCPWIQLGYYRSVASPNVNGWFFNGARESWTNWLSYNLYSQLLQVACRIVIVSLLLYVGTTIKKPWTPLFSDPFATPPGWQYFSGNMMPTTHYPLPVTSSYAAGQTIHVPCLALVY